MKLPEKQMEVLSLMNQGWELGQSFDGRAWLQRDGLGRGGDTKDVHGNTFSSLYNKELVKIEKQGFPTSRYTLTNLAKQILEQG